jgi:ribonucleoside-diphosphate reductase alpha chain
MSHAMGCACASASSKSGVRNSLVIAIAPTATIASIVGCYECIEPQISNLFKRETLSGEFLQVNRYLIEELKERGMWTKRCGCASSWPKARCNNIDGLPDDLKLLYRTVWEVPMRADRYGAARNAYIDQSQSLNPFAESPNIGKLSSMYMYAWKKGLKTTYYLRSRPATKIAKTTVANASSRAGAAASNALPAVATAQEARIACSLENPGSCEACQ